MAAERLTRFQIMIDALPHYDRAIKNHAMQAFFVMAGEISTLYRKGTLSQSAAANELADLMVILEKAISDRTAEIVRNEAEKISVDLVTNNTTQGRSILEFNTLHRGLGTSFISSGIGLAIIHPEIGASVTNQNALTRSDMYSSIMKGFTNPREANKWGDPLKMVDDHNLRAVALKATNDTFDTFGKISPSGIPESGTMFVLFGAENASKTQIETITETTMRAIQRHHMMNDGQFSNARGRQIGFNASGLGYACQFIYGGPNHPNPNYREGVILG